MESEMCVKNRTFEIKLAFSIFGLQMLRALLRSGRLCNVLKERRSCRSLSEAGPGGEEDQQLLRELCAKIRFSGPITVAQYMQEVLTNPVHGIYTNKGQSSASVFWNFSHLVDIIHVHKDVGFDVWLPDRAGQRRSLHHFA